MNILRNNIISFGELNFEKYSENEIANFDVPYDLSSDMHYGSQVIAVLMWRLYLFYKLNESNLFSIKYFSSNSKITIEPKDKRFQRTIGQRLDLSFSDIKTVNKIYCDGNF